MWTVPHINQNFQLLLCPSNFCTRYRSLSGRILFRVAATSQSASARAVSVLRQAYPDDDDWLKPMPVLPISVFEASHSCLSRFLNPFFRPTPTQATLTHHPGRQKELKGIINQINIFLNIFLERLLLRTGKEKGFAAGCCFLEDLEPRLIHSHETGDNKYLANRCRTKRDFPPHILRCSGAAISSLSVLFGSR